MRSTKSGFTTLELMTVLVMFGFVTAIAGPKLYSGYAAVSTRTAADRLARVAELARISAIRYGRDAQLKVDTTTKRFWAQIDTTVGLTGVMDTIGPVQTLPSSRTGMRLTLAGSAASTAIVCFDIRGIRSTRTPCQSGAAIVVFSVDNHVDTVRVTAMGKVIR
jgi:type II secretory pathway pseudopilin PulG